MGRLAVELLAESNTMPRAIPLLLSLAICSCGSSRNEEPKQVRDELRHNDEVGKSAAQDHPEQHPAPTGHDRDLTDCAVLKASYDSERNQLLAGDRSVLRSRLTELGEIYNDRMAKIRGCSFPVL
jgi:hypothetical protein